MKIILLGRDDEYTPMIYHGINASYEISHVITEEPVPKSTFLKRRIKKLGLPKVIGQVFFRVLIVPILDIQAKARKREIEEEYQLAEDHSYQEKGIYSHFDSANSEACIQKVKELHPDIVIVNGTRILSKQLLSCCDAIFINAHMGITPRYRGSHGAYWALYNNDPKHAGVTVHLIDTGIDTGGILYQEPIAITEKDNFVTYPLLQLAKAIELEKKVLIDYESSHSLATITNDLDSALWTHPTLIQYLKARITRNIK